MNSINCQLAVASRNPSLLSAATFQGPSLRLILTALMGLSVLGCAKEDSAPGAQANRSTISVTKTLLDFVPADAVIVNTLDISSSGFQQLKASPYGALTTKLQQGPLASLPQSADIPAGATLAKIVRAAEAAGLLPSLTQSAPDLVQGYVGFFSAEASAPSATPLGLAGAYYFQGAPGVDLKVQLDKLEAALQKEGLAAQRSTQGDRSMLKVRIPITSVQDNSDQGEVTLFALASQQQLALASSESLALRLFNASSLDSLTSSGKLASLSEFLPNQDNTAFSFSYFDVKGLAKAAAARAPEEERTKVLAGLETLPIENIAGQYAMEGAPVVRYAAPYSAKTEEQKKMIASLQVAREPIVFNSGPANSIFLLSIDGALLRQLKEFALLQHQGDAAAKELAAIDGLSGVGLGLANSSGASPFPEIFLLGNGSDGATVATTMKTIAQSLTASSGMPLTPWQKKSISGVTVDYSVSPLGIGLYIGAVGEVVFVASSEGMVSAIIDATSKKSPSLGATYKDLMANAVITSHLNFGRLYDLLTSLQGTLTMFTGGQGFNASEYAGIKELGSLSAAIHADDKALRMEARLRQDPKS